MPSPQPVTHCDILVIGAGIAGASAAAELASEADVMLIEAESQPGYHTTGRSAAFYAQSYGGPAIQPLTTASKSDFLDPPGALSDRPLASPRGALHVFAPDEYARAARTAAALAETIPNVRLLDAGAVLERVPVMRPDRLGGAIDDPDCRDLDVAAIHQAYLRLLRRRGGRVMCDAAVTAMERAASGWRVETEAGPVIAEIAIDAAGAWADEIARMAGLDPVGLTPMRRTVILFRPASAAIDDSWPLVLDLDEDFYFKPETGRILASPADETPTGPCDVQPEAFDIALTVDRIQRATRLDVPRIETAWAGLRSFAPDRVPVVGADPRCTNFIWCAGQGGYGIQTAPAVARLTAAAALGRDPPADLAACGVSPERYLPGRFAAAAQA